MEIINGVGIAIGMIIAFFLGAMMVISTYHRHPERMMKSYPKHGTLLITDIDGDLGADLNLNTDISDVMSSKAIILEVHTQRISREQYEKIIAKEKADESDVHL